MLIANFEWLKIKISSFRAVFLAENSIFIVLRPLSYDYCGSVSSLITSVVSLRCFKGSLKLLQVFCQYLDCVNEIISDGFSLGVISW